MGVCLLWLMGVRAFGRSSRIRSVRGHFGAEVAYTCVTAGLRRTIDPNDPQVLRELG
jgi:hypothetical protein